MFRRVLWLLLVLLFLAGCARPGTSLDTYWNAPHFQLTDQAAQPFNSSALAGRVWLVDFIYTHCPDICPVYLSPRMAQLQQQILARNLVGKVDLVSITVDPQRDTPAVLQEYGARYGADPRVWHFLTGPDATLQSLLQTGFKVGSVVKAETEGNLTHSSYFLLVDRQGKVRALYDGTEVDADKMFADLQQLSS